MRKSDFEEKLRLAHAAVDDIDTFMAAEGRLRLRSYQVEVALRIIESVRQDLGDTIVVQFPRQSGKNELQAQVEVYLLTLFRYFEAELVKVSPTWKPQTLNAMRRLERVLARNCLARKFWQKESGYIYRLGRARIFFLSGSPTTSVVGATASTLLQCDEAQDILASKWDKDFSPMAASTNATRVFWGTAWTSQTLLARERRAAEEAERRDGRRRVFVIDAEQVAQEVPAYGEFVREQVRRLGRSHPLIKTQFFGEEIDAEGGLFPPARLALMRGTHPPQESPLPGRLYAALIDVAGQDEGSAQGAALSAVRGTAHGGGAWDGALGGGEQANSLFNREAYKGRDSTALTLVEVDLETLSDPLLKAPTYRVVSRRLWTGTDHTLLYAQLRSLIEEWRARYVVIDATGVGAGLSSFLERAFPGKVLPFLFSQSSKSRLGWDFLGVVDSGRFKDYDPPQSPLIGGRGLQELFTRQAQHCQYQVLPGPGKVLRWSVPDGFRDPESGELLHDDLLTSAALVAVLDGLEWAVSGPAWVLPRGDPLAEMDGEGF